MSKEALKLGVEPRRGVMDSCKLGTCDALKQAEARVRELEATIDAMAEAHAHDDQALTAAYLSGAHAGKKQAEAFKARVMAWARGRCGACEHEGSEDDTCYNCQSDYEQSNWTPPKAWE